MLGRSINLIELNLKKIRLELTFTCSKSAIETLEKGVKYVKS